MKLGFDNEKYLSEQSEEIRRRAERFGKLYLEFGGKLMNDFHAARCLPGYDPNVKLRLLQSLGDQAEILIAIYSGDIEHKKMRADFGISYADDALKLIDDLKGLGLLVRGIVITRYAGQPAALQFRQRLENRGVSVWFHYVTQGYPADVATIVSDAGYGKNDYVPTERPIVVVTAPGPGSGKFATCLSQIYHESRQGRKAGYSKFESFPVWNMPLEHPLNVAYEAATIDLKDFNMIDPYHLQAYGKTAVNYNRDVEAYPLLRAIWEKMTDGECPYKSPTDMGVNRIGFGIIDDAVVQEASKQENLVYLRGSFTGFCPTARLAGVVTDADIERCQQEAMARFESKFEKETDRGKLRKWLREVVLTDILHRACRMASKKLPADFKAEADTLAQSIRVYASTARETPLQLADVVIDEVRGYYWRESKWTTR